MSLTPRSYVWMGEGGPLVFAMVPKPLLRAALVAVAAEAQQLRASYTVVGRWLDDEPGSAEAQAREDYEHLRDLAAELRAIWEALP